MESEELRLLRENNIMLKYICQYLQSRDNKLSAIINVSNTSEIISKNSQSSNGIE